MTPELTAADYDAALQGVQPEKQTAPQPKPAGELTAADYDAALQGSAVPAAPAPQVPPAGELGVTGPVPARPLAVGDLSLVREPVGAPPAQAEPRQTPDEQRRAEALRWQAANETRAPEEQAEVVRLSVALGWHPEAVAEDLQAARNAAVAQKLDAADIVKNHPLLADLIGDPQTTALVRSDTARLTGLSYLWGGSLPAEFNEDGSVKGAPAPVVDPETVAYWKRRGYDKVPDFALHTLAYVQAPRPTVEGYWSKLGEQRALEREVHAGQEKLLDRNQPLPSKELIKEWEKQGVFIPPTMITDEMRSRREAERLKTPEQKEAVREEVRRKEEELAKLQRYDDGVADHSFVPRTLARTARVVRLSGPEMAKGAAVTAAASAVATPAAGAAAATAYWSQETAPGIYWQLSELRKPDGSPVLSDEEARTYALAGSLPLGYLNAEGLGKMGLGGTAASQVTTRALNTAVERLARPGLQRAVTRFALEYGEHVVTGSLLMGVQSGLQQAYVDAAKSSHGVEADWSLGKTFVEGALQGAQDFALISAWAPAKRLLTDYGRMSTSLDDAQVLRRLAEEAPKSRFAKAAPELFGKFVEATGPTKEVFISADAIGALAQEEKLSARELAARLAGDKGESYDRAQATGGDLQVPVRNWVSEVVMKGREEALRPDTRMGTDRFTPRQIEERARAQVAEVAERLKQDGASYEAGRRELYRQAYDAAREAKYSHERAHDAAEMLSSYAHSMALRLGVPVRDAAVRAGLPQLRLEGVAVFRDNLIRSLELRPDERVALADFDHLSAATLGDLIRLRDEVKSTEGKAALERLSRTAYVDTLTPGGNKAAFGDFNSKPREGVFVALDLNDFKHVNDTFGHERGDELLSQTGKVFSEASRANRGKMFRPGGDEFRFHFATREQAEAFLKQAREGFKSIDHSAFGDYRSSFAAGVSERGFEAADKVSLKAKDAKAAKHGSVRQGNAHPGHGESFIAWDEAGGPRVQDEGAKPSLGGQGALEGDLKQGKRGTIRFRAHENGQPVEFNIEALQGDKSTLAHELSHFFGWSLHRLAQEADAPASIREDYASLLKWAGWDSAPERLAENKERMELEARKDSLTKDEQARLKKLNAKEERVAYGWEQYLAEGKAPKAELRRLFARYRSWMGDLYSSVAGVALQYRELYGEDIQLSDETRRVFDRMLGVDRTVEELRQQDAEADLGSVLNLSGADAEQLRNLREQKYEEARQRLDVAVASSDSREVSGVLADERNRIRAEVDRDLSLEPAYVAWDFLTKGELRVDDQLYAPEQLPPGLLGKDGKPVRLAQKSAYQEGGNALVQKLKRRGLVAKEGKTADELAPLLGFADGKTLLRALDVSEPREAVVERMTQERFEQAFGPSMAKNADALRAQGNDALHSPADIREALFLRQALVRETGKLNYGSAEAELDMMRKATERMVQGTRVSDISPRLALAAERQSQRRAFEAMKQARAAREAGRLEEADQLFSEALQAHDAALLSKLLWRESQKVLDQLDSAEATLRAASRRTWRAALGKAGPELQELNDRLLGALGFGKDEPDPAAVDRALAKLEALGDDSVVRDEATGRLDSALWDSDAVRAALESPYPWDSATAAEALNALDAVQHLRAQADEQNLLRLGDQKMDKADLLAATDASSAKLGDVAGKARAGQEPLKKKLSKGARRVVASIDANLAETEALVERLAGNDREHPLWKLLVGERFRARDEELKLQKETFEEFKKHWQAMPEEMRELADKEAEGASAALPIKVPGIDSDTPVTHGNLWMIALNIGNAGNLQRLLDGYGWTEKQVLAVLQQHLSKAEWGWIQGVWDTLGTLYPHIERVEMEDKGLKPKKVEPRPFKVALADGSVVEMRGGYFPARYEALPGQEVVKAKDISTTQDILTPPYRTASTNQTASKQRANRVEGRALDLNFRVVPDHVAQVIHDVTHRVWVKQAASLILDPRFQTLVMQRLGPEYVPVFKDWLQSVASSHAGPAAGPLRGWERALSYAKSKATLAAVGFNIAVPLNDLTNPLLPVISGDLSFRHLADVSRKLATNWGEMRAFALEKSGELQARAHHGNSLGVGRELGKMMNPSLGSKVEDAAYWMMEQSDKATSTPVWLAKFNEGVAQHGDEAVAIRDADALVRKYFPSNNASEKSALLRNKGLFGSLTFLYGFANKMYGVDRRAVMNLVDAWREPGEAPTLNRAKAVGTLMAILAGHALVLGTVGSFLSGHGPNKKDDKDAGDLALWAVKSAAGQLMYPAPLIGGLGRNGGVPGIRLIQTGWEDARSGDPSLWAALGASLVTRGAGYYQMRKTFGYLGGRADEDLARNRVGDFTSGTVFGQPRKKSSQNYTLLNALGE